MEKISAKLSEVYKMLRPKNAPKDWDEKAQNSGIGLKTSVVVGENGANKAKQESTSPTSTVIGKQSIKTSVVVKQQRKSKKESTTAEEKAHEVDMSSKADNTTAKTEESETNPKKQSTQKQAQPAKDLDTKTQKHKKSKTRSQEHPGVKNGEDRLPKFSRSTSLKILREDPRNFGREPHCSKQHSTESKMQHKVSDPIMDRRESGPIKRTIDDMFDGALSRIYEMTKDAAKRMKRAATEMQHNIYNEIGYQSAAKARELWEDYLEKTPEPPQAERKMKNGETQRNFMSLEVCTYCNRPFTGQEDFDDPDREGEKRPAIK